jgi:hypothetical protein
MVTTHSGTRVHTVLVHTGKMSRTLGIDHTLGLTLDVGVPGVVPDAGAAGRCVDLPAVGVDAAWRRIAGLHNLYRSSCTWSEITTGEGVSDVVLVTDTDRHMRPDPAVGVDATEPGTWVLAVTVDAGELGVTVVIDGALRPAVGRVADHARHAVALALTANISGRQAVGAAWIWLTGV